MSVKNLTDVRVSLSWKNRKEAGKASKFINSPFKERQMGF